MTSIVFVLAVFAVFVLLGVLFQSEPSDAVQAGSRQPTTTTTTEPPPEGVVVVRVSNGSFKPSNLQVQLSEISIVKWVNEDERDYLLAGRAGEFETPLPAGGEFEFDFSTLEPGIYRYFAEIGFQRIPGSIDTRPTQ
jgi:hypothetical protein